MAVNARTTLEDLRREKGLDRSEFARRVGVDRVSVWRWETGRRAMTAAMCQQVADVLGVSMEEVVKAVQQ